MASVSVYLNLTHSYTHNGLGAHTFVCWGRENGLIANDGFKSREHVRT